MKFGILMHKNTQNIGDDIQSFAAANLLPSVDYFVDRETADSFTTDNGEPVAVVMSAWYMWAKWNWPPAKCIVPLYVGMHWADHQQAKQDGTPIKTEFLTGIGAEYLNAYGPVGCRDNSTCERLSKIGIDCYFSGCVTLTLPKMPKVSREREYICVSDLPKELVNKIKSLMKDTGIDVVEITHHKDYRNSTATWEERSKAVTDLLTVYRNAKCVVTRRLHCALPCLAMEVPVLMTNDETMIMSGRFDPYTEWTHHCSYEQLLSGDFSYDFVNPPENPQIYLEYRNSLIKTIKDFVAEYKDKEGDVSQFNRLNYSDEEIVRWRHDTMKSVMYDWLMYTRKDFWTINKLQKQCDAAKSEAEKKLKKAKSDAKKELQNQRDAFDKKLAELEAEHEKESARLAEELAKTKSELKRVEGVNKRYENILHCRPVRSVIKIRNAFMKENKKIKL